MEKFYSNPYGALEMTLLWNNNAVYFMHSLVMYKEDKTHKVVDIIIPISYNPGYIQWLCDNRNELEELFNQGIWYQKDWETKKSHAYSELISYFTNNLETFLQMCFRECNNMRLFDEEMIGL